jgi:hypothetical protein
MNRNNVTTTVIQIMSASQTLSHAVMNANNSPNEANPNRTVTDTQVNKSMKMSPATKLRYRLMADCVPEIAKSFKHFFRLMLHIEPENAVDRIELHSAISPMQCATSESI